MRFHAWERWWKVSSPTTSTVLQNNVELGYAHDVDEARITVARTPSQAIVADNLPIDRKTMVQILVL